SLLQPRVGSPVIGSCVGVVVDCNKPRITILTSFTKIHCFCSSANATEIFGNGQIVQATLSAFFRFKEFFATKVFATSLPAAHLDIHRSLVAFSEIALA